MITEEQCWRADRDVYALDGLDRLNGRPVSVEGTIGVGERGALLNRDSDALLGGKRNGAGRREERESNSDQSGLAEHVGRRRVNELRTVRRRKQAGNR